MAGLRWLLVSLLILCFFLSTVSAQSGRTAEYSIESGFDRRMQEAWVLNIFYDSPISSFNYRNTFPKSEFSYNDIVNMAEYAQRTWINENYMPRLPPRTTGTPTTAGEPQITDTYPSNGEGAGVDNVLQVVEGESLLIYVVVLAMAMITMATIGIKSWFGYVIGVAIVTAITWIFTGGVPLLIPASVIIILFVMHSLGARS